MKKGKKRSLQAVLLALVALMVIVVCSIQGCKVKAYTNDGGSNGNTNTTLASLSLTSSSITMNSGTKTKISATGLYSDATTTDMTSSVVWSSSDPTVTVVKGLITAPAISSQKTCTITATEAGGLSAHATVTIKDLALSALEISTTGAGTIDQGMTAQFTATGSFGAGADLFTQDISSSATWSTSDAAVADIDSSGLATGKSSGSTSITASWDGMTSNALTLAVSGKYLSSITLSDALGNGTNIIDVDNYDYFSATGLYSDGTTQDITESASWSSSDTTIAQIKTINLGAGGMGVMGMKAGTATITATLGTVHGDVLVTVEVGAGY